MDIIHNQRIRATTLPTSNLSFDLLNLEIQLYLTKHKMVQSFYKVRDNTEGMFYIYLTNNGRLDVNYK